MMMMMNAKAILLEEQYWYYLTHRWEDKGAHTFPESERNSATGAGTRVLRFSSPTL